MTRPLKCGKRMLVKSRLTPECLANGEMRKFCGQVVTIKGSAGQGYRIEEDSGKWLWFSECFEFLD